MSESSPIFTRSDLDAVLAESQRLGFLGPRPIPEVIEHSQGFVEALIGVSGRIADIGSGGGVPGFVVIAARPDLHVTMIDRRTKRTDAVERMVARHGLRARAAVIAGEVEEVITASPSTFDAVIARGFGPPMVTLTLASQLVRSGGRVVISEPPEGDRWEASKISSVGVSRVDGPPNVAVFERL